MLLLQPSSKGQLISKANCQTVNSSKKRTNEFVFTTMGRVLVCFLEEIEDIRMTFRNYLTFINVGGQFLSSFVENVAMDKLCACTFTRTVGTVG